MGFAPDIQSVGGTRLTSHAVALMCSAYVAVAILLAPVTYFDMLTAYTLKKYSLALPVLFIFGMAAAGIICSPRAPLTFIREKLRSRGIGALIIMAFFLLGAAAFSTLKHVTPVYVPFFSDPFLAKLDAVIHFGDPWRATQAIFPSSLEPALFVLYGPVWFIQMVGMVMIAAFTQDRQRRTRYLLSFLLVAFVLGTVIRIAGSSAGPILYGRIVGGDRFSDLMISLGQSWSGQAMIETSNYLFNSFANDRTVFGTGIAAMPSLHVAVALLNALFLSGFNRPLRWWGWFYFASVMLGSVYFGWHYAIDGYVSIVAVLLIWSLAGRLGKRHLRIDIER